MYYRYLYDIFGVWTQGLNNTFLISPINTLKALTSNLQQVPTQSTSWTQQSFLHPLTTKIRDYIPKNFYASSLLHKSSYHPKHTFKRLIKSQLIRFHKLCSFDIHFQATQTRFRALRTRVLFYSKRFLHYVKRDTLRSLAD